MAMMRSALARVFRRSSGSCRAPRRRPETDQAPPPLPSLRPAAPSPWVLPRPGSATHPQPQMVRTFMSAAAASAPNRRIPNLNLLQGQRYFPVISKGTEGMKWAGQKRFLSAERNANSGAKLMESARLAARRINEWGNRPSSAKTEFVLVAILNVIWLGLLLSAYYERQLTQKFIILCCTIDSALRSEREMVVMMMEINMVELIRRAAWQSEFWLSVTIMNMK